MSIIDFEENPIIAAVRSYEDFRCALSSNVSTIFLLSCDLLSIDRYTKEAHEAEKKLFVHIDFLDGISKDAAGVSYLATKNIDGIISTRSNVIKCASDRGITTVQRFFMVDSRSVDTALDSLRSSHPDMIEVMPAIAYKTITKIKNRTSLPIIAGGLIEEKNEIFSAFNAGASGVSTAAKNMWNI
ncbi:MAG: glycerol-3-phosphate responsive antiterminator [Clostridia bacterium]|nr:glycerol-3-phosphate responsive antiterminator [Clostridia bacterium]